MKIKNKLYLNGHYVSQVKLAQSMGKRKGFLFRTLQKAAELKLKSVTINGINYGINSEPTPVIMKKQYNLNGINLMLTYRNGELIKTETVC